MVPKDVDFVARFLSNRRFFGPNSRISRIVLRDKVTSELSATTIIQETRK